MDSAGVMDSALVTDMLGVLDLDGEREGGLDFEGVLVIEMEPLEVFEIVGVWDGVLDDDNVSIKILWDG